MISRKTIWFIGIYMLIVTIFLLFLGYSVGFSRNDKMKMDMLFTLALMSGICFFYLFPVFRIDTEYSRFKKQLSEQLNIDISLTQKPKKENAERKLKRIIEIVIIIFATIFISFNYVLGHIAYNNSNHSKLIFHMIVIITTSLAFFAFLLTSKISGCFTQLRDFISELNKGQTPEGKSE
jgi:TRAP-type C4-dicarboxylate transport system permease small subunit